MLEQRKSLLRKRLRDVPMLSARRIEEIMNKIIGMESELGADKYGHVKTSMQVSSTNTTTTTTTLNPQQRMEAGQLYLQSPSASTCDPQQVRSMYNEIVAGSRDDMASSFLNNQKQIAAPPLQQNVLRDIQQPLVPGWKQGMQQTQPPQQSTTYQSSLHNALVPHPSAPHHQAGAMQHQVAQPASSSSRHRSKHPSKHDNRPAAFPQVPPYHTASPSTSQAPQQNPFEQMHVSVSSTTTTTTTSNGSQGYQPPHHSTGLHQQQHALPQQQPQALPAPQSYQQTQQVPPYEQPVQQATSQHRPYGSSRHHGTSAKALPAPTPTSSKQISDREKRRARMAEYERKYGR